MVDLNVFHSKLEIISLSHWAFFVDIQILESEILQFVLVGLSDVEEYVAAQADIAQRHVVGT